MFALFCLPLVVTQVKRDEGQSVVNNLYLYLKELLNLSDAKT